MRLIDADAFKARMNDLRGCAIDVSDVLTELDDMPTMNGWHDARKEYPSDTRICYICKGELDKSNISEGYYTSEGWISRGITRAFGVTYWHDGYDPNGKPPEVEHERPISQS